VNIEELLRDSLREEAARTEHQPTPLEQVAWRARSLRRTRRARVAGVSLVAAAAVVTPVALTVPGMLAADRDREAGSEVLASLPDSGTPSVAWTEGSTYVAPDGRRIVLPVDDVKAFVPYRGGVVVTTGPTGSSDLARVVTVSATGEAVAEECGSDGLGLDADGAVVVTATVYRCNPRWSGSLLTWRAVDGPAPADDELASPTGYPVQPVAVRDDLTYYTWTRLDGSRPEVVRLVTGLGPPEPIPGLVDLADVSADGRWLAGTTGDGRHVVVDSETGDVRTELASQPVSWSPDDRYLAAVSESGRLEVVDATTGEAVLRPGVRTESGGAGVAWESGSRLLAVAVDGDDEALVRVDLDGTVSRASEVSPSGSLSLVTQP
jgi:hypothetical protein